MSGAYIKSKRETLSTAIKTGSTMDVDVELVQIQALQYHSKCACHRDGAHDGRESRLFERLPQPEPRIQIRDARSILIA